jgi:hypothetical protein
MNSDKIEKNLEQTEEIQIFSEETQIFLEEILEEILEKNLEEILIFLEEIYRKFTGNLE